MTNSYNIQESPADRKLQLFRRYMTNTHNAKDRQHPFMSVLSVTGHEHDIKVALTSGNASLIPLPLSVDCSISIQDVYGTKQTDIGHLCETIIGGLFSEMHRKWKESLVMQPQFVDPSTPAPQLVHGRGQNVAHVEFQKHLAELTKEAWKAGESFGRTADRRKNPLRAMFKFMRECGYYVPERFVRSLENKEDERLDQLRTDR